MAKKKVFFSFDFENDKKLKTFIIAQAKNPDSPFEVSDFSLKEAKPEADWLNHARRAIGRAEVFIIMLGPKTKRAPGVLKELEIAIEKGKKRFQIIGYQEGSSDEAVPGGGTTYRWNWPNLKKLLS